jgi:aspartyl-tRNA(Asn)/glutamyl-tRNA(Gln) amidotransferase subunit B
MPELPAARRARYQSAFGLSPYDAAVITTNGSAYFDAAMAAGGAGADAKRTASLFSKIALRELKKAPDMLESRDPTQLARVVALVSEGQITSQNAEQVYERHLQTGQAIDEIVAQLGLKAMGDAAELGEVIDRVIEANPAAVADFHAGKAQAVKFLTGQAMKETRGQANPQVLQRLLEERLSRS